MRPKHALVLTAMVLLVVWVCVTAAEKVVTLKDGRKLAGEVTETSDGYEIRIRAGAVVVVSKDNVASVEDVKTSQSEYQLRLAKTDLKNPDSLYALARWATDNEMLTEARDVLKKVLALKSDHENAKLLLRLVEIRLARTTEPALPPTTGPAVPATGKLPLLKTEDVYRIRLLELRADDRARIEFRDDLLERFIESMRGVGIFAERGGETRFRTMSRVAQARYILENTDRDSALRDDILVKSDPAVITQFRTRVWPIISRGCATASCHGGVKAVGGLRLFSMPLKDERVVYTNFYILSEWSGGRKLIDRGKPEMSRLLQYGLPKELAKAPHPKAFTPPLFLSPRDRNHKFVEDWIRSLRHPLVGGYRIDYKIPGLPEPTTAPSPFEE